MTGRGVSEPCSAELAGIIVWVAGLGAVTAEALARQRGWGVPSARARLSRAERTGLLRAWRPLRDQPVLYTATRAGLRAAELSGIDPARVSPAGARHGVLCALCASELQRFYPGHRVIGEPELRREERLSGSRLASVAPSRPGAASHRPDLALLPADPGMPAIAVEVELTVKSPRRLAAICLAWARARHVAGVVYLAGESVRPALGRAIEESRAGGRIVVLELETLEAGEGSTGAIARAITGAP